MKCEIGDSVILSNEKNLSVRKKTKSRDKEKKKQVLEAGCLKIFLSV